MKKPQGNSSSTVSSLKRKPPHNLQADPTNREALKGDLLSSADILLDNFLYFCLTNANLSGKLPTVMEKSGESVKMSSGAIKKLRRMKKATGKTMTYLLDEAVDYLYDNMKK